jgi:hypothetical protein
MQLTYSLTQAAARIGMVADASMVQDIESYKNAAGEVKFGGVVTKGAATDLVIHPDAAAKVTDEKLVRGIVVASHELESKEDGALPGYKAESVVPVMRKGRVWVQSYTAVTEGTSTPNVIIEASGSETQLGFFRAAANGTFTALLPKAKWKSTTTGASQLALLEIDL